MPQISEQVVVDVQKCLSEHGYSKLTDERVNLLKGQVGEVHKHDHPVYKIKRK